MSGRVALDTEVCIKFLNGDRNIESLLHSYSEFHLPVVVVGELMYGAMNSKHVAQNLARHKRLIQKSDILEIKETTAAVYAKARIALKKAGKPIPENDLWIASICIENKIPFISSDVHFTYIDHLKLVQPSSKKN